MTKYIQTAMGISIIINGSQLLKFGISASSLLYLKLDVFCNYAGHIYLTIIFKS